MIRGINVFFAGVIVCQKKNRNEQEELAAKAFKRLMIAAVIPILVYIVLAAVWLVPELERSINGGESIYSSYVKRAGHVKDGQVRYVQGENKYVSLERINLSEEDVKDGDELTLFFDSSTDELLFGKSTKDLDTLMGISFAKLVGSGIFVVICYIFIATAGKQQYFNDFYLWYEKMKQKNSKI